MTANDKWLFEMRGNWLLLLATISFQNVVNPSGGVYPQGNIRAG